MNRRGFLKTLAGLPVLALVKPERVGLAKATTAREIHTGRAICTITSTSTHTLTTSAATNLRVHSLNSTLGLDYVEHAAWFKNGIIATDGNQWVYLDA